MNQKTQKAGKGAMLFGILLTLLFPGLGHWYLGSRRKAIVLGSITLTLAIVRNFHEYLYVGYALLIYPLYLFAFVTLFLDRKKKSPTKRPHWAHCLALSVPAILLLNIHTVALQMPEYLPFRLVTGFQIPTRSNEPNLLSKDRILCRMGRSVTVNRGDMAVFRFPRQPEEIWVKRLLGLPGDHLVIKNDRLIINGEPLTYTDISEEFAWYPDYLADYPLHEARPLNLMSEQNGEATYPLSMGSKTEDQELTLGENEYYMIGDNRDHSYDSRAFGPVSGDLIVGRATFIYWPSLSFDRFGFL